MLRNLLFYHLKPFIPRRLQIALRRILARRKLLQYTDVWPIDYRSAKKPDTWLGWPHEKRFAVILTHDVESTLGVEKCLALAEVEKKHGFRSSFNFVIQDYHTPSKVRHELVEKGFEVGVHGLTHDGKFFLNQNEFFDKYHIINQHLSDWNAVGYRTPAMLGNLKWLHLLDIEYDLSTFDTDPFEPNPIGVQSIFPFYEESNEHGSGFLELPYTLAQDFTLFVIMQEQTIDIWKKKIDWIAEQGGMVLVNVHPDYINFTEKECGLQEYPLKIYQDLLEYMNVQYEGQFWNVPAKEMTEFWKKEVIPLQ